MEIKYVFDVDGTLTPSRALITPRFGEWFANFCDKNDVYLVTGSDRSKTLEQVGENIYNKCKRVYNCSGSDVYEGNKNIRSSEWEVPKDLFDLMEGWLQSSSFAFRTGNHMEERPGMVNFSIVGRNATPAQRLEYVKHDKANRERESIAYEINSNFHFITAHVGGETGIDIHPTDADKSQILTDFNKGDIIYFYGDAIFTGGNDMPLAEAIKTHKDISGKSFRVVDWYDTWKKLEEQL